MSKSKRFSVDYDEKANRVIYFDNKEPLTFLEVVNCLNEQQSTIELIKKESICLASMFEKEIKENKKLQKELTDCEKFRYAVFKKIEELK